MRLDSTAAGPPLTAHLGCNTGFISKPKIIENSGYTEEEQAVRPEQVKALQIQLDHGLCLKLINEGTLLDHIKLPVIG